MATTDIGLVPAAPRSRFLDGTFPMLRAVLWAIIGFIIGAWLTALLAGSDLTAELPVTIGYVFAVAGWVLGGGAWEGWVLPWFGVPSTLGRGRGHCALFPLQYRPQGHRSAISVGGDLRLRHRRRARHGHAHRADVADVVVLLDQPELQHSLLHSRHADAVCGRCGGHRRRFRQLLRAAHDRCRGHDVPQAERRELVARVARRLRHPAEPAGRRLSDRLDRLRAALGDGCARPGPLLSRRPFARPVVAVDGHQRHRDDALYAGARTDNAASAGLRLVDAGDLGAQPDLGPGDRRGDGDGAARPADPHQLLLRRRGCRFCGRTSSGCSAIRRSTSSCCRHGACGWRSSRCSAASRCSATTGSLAGFLGVVVLSSYVWTHHMFTNTADDPADPLHDDDRADLDPDRLHVHRRHRHSVAGPVAAAERQCFTS